MDGQYKSALRNRLTQTTVTVMQLETVEQGEALTVLPDGLSGPSWFEFAWKREGGEHDIDADIFCHAEFIDDRYVITEMQFTGGPINGNLLRSVPVQEVLRDAVYDLVSMEFNYRDAKQAMMSDDKLKAVSIIYRMALLAGDPPKQAVARRLDVPVSTAGRWISKAREQNYLAKTQERRARA